MFQNKTDDITKALHELKEQYETVIDKQRERIVELQGTLTEFQKLTGTSTPAEFLKDHQQYEIHSTLFQQTLDDYRCDFAQKEKQIVELQNEVAFLTRCRDAQRETIKSLMYFGHPRVLNDTLTRTQEECTRLLEENRKLVALIKSNSIPALCQCCECKDLVKVLGV